MKVGLIWTGSAFVPYSEIDARAIRECFGAGETATVKVTKARNLGHHRLFFAILNELVDAGLVRIDATDHADPSLACVYDIVDLETLRSRVLVLTGHCTRMGEIYIPHSISFESMDELKFSAVADDVITYLADHVESAPDALLAAADDVRAKHPRPGRKLA